MHAYLLFSGLILILKVNKDYPHNNRLVTASTAFIFLVFLLLFTLEGSKASILSTVLLFMIYPISALRWRRIEFIILPSAKLLLALTFLSLLIFYYVSLYRDLPHNQIWNFDTFFNAPSLFSFEALYNLKEKILYRFSAGALIGLY